jgi:hypothetical protein
MDKSRQLSFKATAPEIYPEIYDAIVADFGHRDERTRYA